MQEVSAEGPDGGSNGLKDTELQNQVLQVQFFKFY